MPISRRGLLGVALTAGTLEACSPFRAFNTLTPRPAGYERGDKAVPYGPLARQKLDIYRPTAPAPVPGVGRPILVFFYGGSWERGERANYAFAGRAYAARGFVTLIVDYRLTGEAPYPAFLQDAALAVAWAQAHAAELGGDSSRVVLAGHSAGAYIAAMLALDPSWLAEAGAAQPVRGWAGLSGPYDFLPLDPGVAQRTFGRAPDAARTQPITFVHPGAPPAFLGHGGADTVVRPRNAEILAERLTAAGVPVDLEIYPHIGHAEVVLALAWPLSLRVPVLRQSAAFLARVAASP